jgi:thymidylate synthase
MSERAFRSIYKDVATKGVKVSPRGLTVLEIENYSYVLNPYERFVNFKSRKFNLNYVKTEFLWYLKGDKYDTSIADHAKIWKGTINEDGSINSNYGQYVFGAQKQFDIVVNTLKNDKDSRRASMMILSKDTLTSDRDVPCTYALNFRIRENKLNMTVHMRSQDAIFGMGNDAPCFSFMHEMILNALKEFYPELEYGDYTHFADSFHVYERHFEMLVHLANKDAYTPIYCPPISGPDEVKFLRELDFKNVPDNYKFTQWLLTQN